MSVKVIILLCAQALLIKSAFSQCASRAAIDASGIGSPYLAGPGLAPALAGPGLGCNGLAGPLAYNGLAPNLGLPGRALPLEFTATSGGSLPVTSSSAIAPTGISIISENKFEGSLSLAGELPFVGTSGMEGTIPTAGAGAINHACGDGITAIISEASIPPIAATFGPAAAISPLAVTPAAATFGPAAGAFGPAPFAGRFGLGPCASSFVN